MVNKLSLLSSNQLKEENTNYFAKTESAFSELFLAAKSKDELQFVLSLNSEFRGEQDTGWSTADEAIAAFNDYVEFINKLNNGKMRIRIALSFYCQIAEASGFYEILKNMIRVVDGQKYSMWPFQEIVKRHADSGKQIAPNSNAVMKNIIGHAKNVGLNEVVEVCRDAFDADIRNAFAHADYIVWEDGLRLRFRNGGYPRKIEWDTFSAIYDRGINFFNILKSIVDENIRSYFPAKIIRGQLNNEPAGEWKIEYNNETGSFSISSR